MATTRESFEDGLRWVGRLLAVGLRRGTVLAVIFGLFALAVVFTTRESVSDCGDVTDAQRAALTSLLEREPTRTFVASDPARCVDGVYAAPIQGLAGEIDAVTAELEQQGWVAETNFTPAFQRLWRRCFRRDLPGWQRVQLLVEASRGGVVQTVRATAPEQGDACDLERRDESTIYPPSD